MPSILDLEPDDLANRLDALAETVYRGDAVAYEPFVDAVRLLDGTASPHLKVIEYARGVGQPVLLIGVALALMPAHWDHFRLMLAPPGGWSARAGEWRMTPVVHRRLDAEAISLHPANAVLASILMARAAELRLNQHHANRIASYIVDA